MLGVMIAVVIKADGKSLYFIYCIDLVLDVIEPYLFMVLDVMEPCFVFSSCCYRTFVYWWVQGVTMPDVIGIYFKFNSGDLTSTSSQVYGSWNLPMFLLRDGPLTLMKIASLMFLVILLSSLPTMLKLFRDTSWPVMFWWSMMGDGALIFSLNISPKVLPDSPMYSSSQSTFHICTYCYVGQYGSISIISHRYIYWLVCLGVNTAFYSVYCNTQLLVFRFSFLCIT